MVEEKEEFEMGLPNGVGEQTKLVMMEMVALYKKIRPQSQKRLWFLCYFKLFLYSSIVSITMDNALRIK